MRQTKGVHSFNFSKQILRFCPTNSVLLTNIILCRSAPKTFCVLTVGDIGNLWGGIGGEWMNMG